MDENNITQEQATMTVQNGQAQEPAAGTGAAQQPAASAAAPEKKPERTFTREDVNKMIAAEVSKALQKQQEADRLANMTEAERVQHEHDEAIRRADEAEQALNGNFLHGE